MLMRCEAILKESEAHMVKQGQVRVHGRFSMDSYATEDENLSWSI